MVPEVAFAHAQARLVPERAAPGVVDEVVDLGELAVQELEEVRHEDHAHVQHRRLVPAHGNGRQVPQEGGHAVAPARRLCRFANERLAACSSSEAMFMPPPGCFVWKITDEMYGRAGFMQMTSPPMASYLAGQLTSLRRAPRDI